MKGEYEQQRVTIVFCPQCTVLATPITLAESKRVGGEVKNKCKALALTDAVVKEFMRAIWDNSSPSTLPGRST